MNISSQIKNINFISGNNFNLSTFKKARNSDFIHISTHAFSDTLNRLNNYLVLRESVYNAKIYSTDILKYESVPMFIKLNACETCRGIHITGEGVFSISRAFLQKEAEAILKTLWKIDDEASSIFVTNFYKNWLSGLSISEALHLRKQEFQRTEFSHPYY